MRVLYISDRQPGGIVSHVKCLTSCLPPEVERYVIGVDGDEPFAGKSGHDIREWFQIRRVIKTFKPDVIHFHTIPLLMALYVKVSRFPVACSIHTPSNPNPRFSRRLVNWAIEPCYWLPVSKSNWERFKAYHPGVRGEVFFNPIKIEKLKSCKVERLNSSTTQPFNPSTLQPFNHSTIQPFNSSTLTIGMVGRNAEVKDWPSFHKVEEVVKEKASKFQGFKVSMLEFAERKVEEWLMGVTRETFVAALEGLITEKEDAGEYRFRREDERRLALEGAKRFFDEFSRKVVALSDGRCVYFAPDARSKGRNGGDLARCWAEYAFHAVSNGGRRLEGKSYNERWYHPHKAANFGQLIATLKSERCFVRLRDDVRNDSILFLGDVAAGLSFDVVTRLDEFGNMDANLTEVTFEVASRREKKLPRLVPLAEAVQTVVHHQTTAGSYPLDVNNIPNNAPDDKGAMVSGLKGFKISGLRRCNVEFLNAGENEPCNGREAIRQMDLFMMTSKSEELPTVMLECFALGTPICGFLPRGGTKDILDFSQGPLRAAFIEERDCEKLADLVMDLLAHPEKRQALVDDGRQILEGHFDAEKNVRGQLMRVYEGLKG